VNASRPYVDRPVADRDAALRTAGALAETWGLPAPKLLRHGMNSLYVAGGVVLRVGAATAPAAASHELARWLIDAGIPTIPPVDGLAADADGFAVTGWRFVRETRRAVDWRAVGAAVRQVHALDPADVPAGYPVPDPSTFPWWAFDELLDDVADDLDPGAHDALRATIDRHRGWCELVRRSAVLCHGDVHPGNVLMSGSGALLVDWDLMCVADPAWDHAMLTTYAERWGGDAGAYPAFAEGYGRSLADDDLATTLAELRNVAATIMRVRAGRTDPAAAEEAARRLRWWRGDPDAPVWRAQ
jgi:aminoglycoside phosphotransferase (APT) family kinase protein